MEGLTEGRIVHYVWEEGVHLPALVVRIEDRGEGRVNLCVFADTLQRSSSWDDQTSTLVLGVPYDGLGSRAVDSWHWIERA